MAETAGEEAKLATVRQPVPISQATEEDAETKTAKVTSARASSVGTLVGEPRPIASTWGKADHETDGSNNFEPWVLLPPWINRHAAGSYEERYKPIPGEQEQEPPPRGAAEASPSPKHMSVRDSKSKEGATSIKLSRAGDTQQTTTNTAGYAADAGGAGENLELEDRPRVVSMSGLERNSERVSHQTTA